MFPVVKGERERESVYVRRTMEYGDTCGAKCQNRLMLAEYLKFGYPSNLKRGDQ